MIYARYNEIRRQRGIEAVQLDGLWMSVDDLQKNLVIAKENKDDELQKLFETGLQCYQQNKDLFKKMSRRDEQDKTGFKE